MRKIPEGELESGLNNFALDDIIACPSSLTNVTWRIIKIDSQGNIHAIPVEGQQLSKYNPKKITITPEAFNAWKKVF